MTSIVTTESGARYLIDHHKVTRCQEDSETQLRKDGESVEFVFWGKPTVGSRMVMFLPNLDGNPGVTMRTTTPIVQITQLGE